MLSTAKAEAVSRDLKQALEKRGQIVVESALPKGRKLTINGNHFSIRIEAMDAVSKDVFGNDLDAFTPHEVKFSINQDVVLFKDTIKIMMELGKIGFGLKVGSVTGGLAAAEADADAATVEPYNVSWPTKGA
jgi:hypothetical protein